MGVDEWNALPWWQSVMYMAGLEKQGIIGDGRGNQNATVPTGKSSGPGNAPPVDYADDPLGAIPRGFTTRRAG